MRGQIQKRLEICRFVRNMAAQSCLRTIQFALHSTKKVSELQFRNRWYKELARIKSINPSGWYDPPEYGMGVLFGTQKDISRVNYTNLRNKECWPQLNKYFCNENGVGYLFASPFAILDNIPIIGDFGLSYYIGTNESIREHFRKCHTIITRLINDIRIGMTFGELYQYVLKIIKENRLINTITSTTDPTGTDIGHTIPFIDEEPSDQLKSAVLNGDESKIHSLISKTRRFINAQEDYIISNNCAFTFEPRLIPDDDSEGPMYSFHTIIQMDEGKKMTIGNFDGVINELGMKWLYN